MTATPNTSPEPPARMPAARRRGLEALAVIVAYVVASFIDAGRTCESPEYGLPVSCDPVAVWFVVLFALGLAAFEIAKTVGDRSTSRRCPRCGNRVPNGVMDCGSCDFDFRMI